jgi:hypothetical protein
MYVGIVFIVAFSGVISLYTPTQILFVLYENRHVDSMHDFSLDSIEIFKITDQNTAPALFYLFTFVY